MSLEGQQFLFCSVGGKIWFCISKAKYLMKLPCVSWLMRSHHPWCAWLAVEVEGSCPLHTLLVLFCTAHTWSLVWLAVATTAVPGSEQHLRGLIPLLQTHHKWKTSRVVSIKLTVNANLYSTTQKKCCVWLGYINSFLLLQSIQQSVISISHQALQDSNQSHLKGAPGGSGCAGVTSLRGHVT